MPNINDVQVIPQEKIKIKDGKAFIEIQNNSLNGYGYKIRTTSPTSYQVQPNIGILKPLDTVKIAVSALNEEIKTKTGNKFKVEIVKFNHKKSIDELKVLILETQEPKISKILLVEHSSEHKETVDTKDDLFDHLILLATFITLLYLLPMLASNFLFL